ncbi:MAG: hypothetical protein GWP61_17185 [Chloroflexi bacterium]|jgi:uncharacterized RDD family membrane protein YckC|nr:hypothetical protein [Chloroflexota bacterium]
MKTKTKTPPPSPLQGHYAGFASRFIAYIIDLAVIIGTITIVGIVISLLLQFFRLDDLISNLLSSENLLGDILRVATFLGSIAFIAFSYHVLFWTFTAGKSVGKALVGLRVVPMDGSRITLWRAIVRYFAFLLSAIVLFLGLLWVLISDNRQGWHDKIARTYVIYDWPAREDENVLESLQGRWHNIKHTRKRFQERRAERRLGGPSKD